MLQQGAVEEVKIHLVRQDDVLPDDLKERLCFRIIILMVAHMLLAMLNL